MSNDLTLSKSYEHNCPLLCTLRGIMIHDYEYLIFAKVITVFDCLLEIHISLGKYILFSRCGVSTKTDVIKTLFIYLEMTKMSGRIKYYQLLHTTKTEFAYCQNIEENCSMGLVFLNVCFSSSKQNL